MREQREGHLRTVRLEEIKVSNPYLRIGDDVESLVKSIKAIGLISPLVVNEELELLAGGRRYTALKELGIEEAPVVVVYRNNLEQELISIDENLVRKELKGLELEKSLNRGREIYETLFPEAIKCAEVDLSKKAQEEETEEVPEDKKSFIDVTHEKTGLSKKVIKSAIERDAKSSKRIKEMRELGHLNASQTNNLLELSSDEQDEVADYVIGKSAKEIKKIVKEVRSQGLKEALEKAKNLIPQPKEYQSLKTLSDRFNKNLSKVLIEELHYQGDDKEKFITNLVSLRNNLDRMISFLSFQEDSMNEMSHDDETLEDFNSPVINSEEIQDSL